MDGGLEALINDFAAERLVTQRVLEGLPDDDLWECASSADGWSLRDCAAHTGSVDESVASLILGVESPGGSRAGSDEAFGTPSEVWLADLAPKEFLRAWIDAGDTLIAAFGSLSGDERLPWSGRTMSAKSMVTSRLMEHWSHGLDLNDAAQVPREDSDRLIHVAHLGYMTRAFAYQNRGLAAPETPLFISLESPSGAHWTWGPEDAPDRIFGTAGDFCRVATRRIHVEDTALRWEGEGAGEYLEIIQAFAGPAGDDRPPRGRVQGVYAGRLGGSTNPRDVSR